MTTPDNGRSMTHLNDLYDIPEYLTSISVNIGGISNFQNSGALLTPYHVITEAHSITNPAGNIDVLSGSKRRPDRTNVKSGMSF